jgi:hypothetical protein
MARPKQNKEPIELKPIETKTETPAVEIIQEPEQINFAFEQLDELFRVNEDNWNPIQDKMLLDLLENDNRFNDKVKIQWMFKRYRDTARELNGF